jgi:hypothetical protein
MHARACAPWHHYAAAGQCAVVSVRFGHGLSGSGGVCGLSVLAVECAACRVGFRLSSFSLVLPVVPVVVAAGAGAAALATCMLLAACRVALGVYSRVALGIYSRVALGIYSRVALGIFSRIYNRTGHVVHHEVQPRARLERVLQKHTREALQTPPRCHAAAAHWNGLAGGFRWIRYNRSESGGFSAKGQCD